jgi:hypothetical protein
MKTVVIMVRIIVRPDQIAVPGAGVGDQLGVNVQHMPGLSGKRPRPSRLLRRLRLLAGLDHRDPVGELALELTWRRFGFGRDRFRHGPLNALAAVAAADFGLGDLDRLAGFDSELLELLGEDRADLLADVERAFFGGKHRLHAAELALNRSAFGRAHAQLDRNVGLKFDDGD